MSHPTRLYEVEVCHTQYGVTRVRAHSEAEALALVEKNPDEDSLEEGWISIKWKPISARPKDFQTTLEGELNKF